MESLLLLSLAVAEAEGPSRAYLQAVERYRRGDRAVATREVLPEEGLAELAALRRLERAARACGPCDASALFEAFPFEAAAMLHTDRGLSAIEERPSSGASELDRAGQILELIPDAGRRGRFEHRWLLAIGLELHRRMGWELALGFLDAATQRYPGDPDLLLARGSLLETLSRLQEAWRHADSTRDQLIAAEDCYRRVVAARPREHEARVRLARVLQRRGHMERSIPELETVLATADVGANERYLARLFLGAAHEAAGKLEKAVAAYEAAVGILPGCQAGHVALSQVLHRAGDRARSLAVLQAGLARAGRRPRSDPWWNYPWGRSDQAQNLLEALRREVSP
jgi:tetratricopeptide (TPR) repeat protein